MAVRIPGSSTITFIVPSSDSAGYWHQQQMDELRIEHGVQLLIPPDASNRTTSRPGWNGGRYAPGSRAR